MALRLHGGNVRTRPQGHLAWAPTLTSHNPNPPLPLETAAAPPSDPVLGLPWLTWQDVPEPTAVSLVDASWALVVFEDGPPPPLPDGVGSMTTRGLRPREASLRRIYPTREWFARNLGPRWR